MVGRSKTPPFVDDREITGPRSRGEGKAEPIVVETKDIPFKESPNEVWAKLRRVARAASSRWTAIDQCLERPRWFINFLTSFVHTTSTDSHITRLLSVWNPVFRSRINSVSARTEPRLIYKAGKIASRTTPSPQRPYTGLHIPSHSCESRRTETSKMMRWPAFAENSAR